MKKLLLFGVLAFGLNAFGQVPSYVPTNGLVGWWPFNANANDESGNGLNGTPYLNPLLTNGHNGNPNSAYDFEWDNVTGYGNPWQRIEIPSTNALENSNVTINAWINPETYYWPTNSVQTSMIIGSSNECGTVTDFRFSIGADGVLKFLINGTSPAAISPVNTIALNQWQMVTAVVNSNSIELFVNGLSVHVTSYTGAPNFTGCFVVGEHHQGNGHWYYFDGAIDDIGLWSRALSNCEILELFNEQLNNTQTTVTQNDVTLTADQTGATYQWLDCDNNYAEINGETNQSFTSGVTGNYAVEVTLNGCVDTSACYLVDYTGIEELLQTEKELVKIVDFMGRETEYKPNTPLIFIYSDGTRERVMKLEE